MDYTYTRRYRGPVRAVVFDWAGTTIDPYVLAPVGVFIETFALEGVSVTQREAREPMGVKKDEHIRRMCAAPALRDRWAAAHAGRAPDEADVQRMYEATLRLQPAALRRHASLVPGAADVVQRLRREFGVKIGSDSGYTRALIDVLLEEAEPQGYRPDASVGGDDVQHGSRPAPFMLYRNMELLNVHPVEAVVKVDDTTVGVLEGLEAGCWTVGVVRYGNYMEIDSVEQGERLDGEELELRMSRGRRLLRECGAHYVVDSVADLPEVLTDINARLARGEKP